MARRGREPIGRLRGALDSPGQVWGATRGRPRAGGAGRIIGFRPFLVKTRESPRLQQPVWTPGAPCLADLPPGAGGAGRRGPRRRCVPVTGLRRSLRPLQRAPGVPEGVRPTGLRCAEDGVTAARSWPGRVLEGGTAHAARQAGCTLGRAPGTGALNRVCPRASVCRKATTRPTRARPALWRGTEAASNVTSLPPAPAWSGPGMARACRVGGPGAPGLQAASAGQGFRPLWVETVATGSSPHLWFRSPVWAFSLVQCVACPQVSEVTFTCDTRAAVDRER